MCHRLAFRNFIEASVVLNASAVATGYQQLDASIILISGHVRAITLTTYDHSRLTRESGMTNVTRVDVDDEHGSVYAYRVHADAEQVTNRLIDWLGVKAADAMAQVIRISCQEVVMCQSIHVDKEYRGQGIGTRLLGDLLDACDDVPVFLLCDRHEAQAPGFNLKKWYEAHGFREVSETSSGPLMVCPEDKAEEILRSLR